MLDLSDRLELPCGVCVEEDTIVDTVRGERFPANPAALVVLQDAGQPLSSTAQRLRARWGLEPERAREDVLAFAWFLNGALLANVRRGRSRRAHAVSWLVLALRLLPAGRLPERTAHRAPLDTTSVVRAAVDGARALLGRVTAIALVVATAVGQLWLLGGRAAVGEPVALGVSTGLGLLLHELAHVSALVGVPSALALVGRRTMVLHRPVAGGRAVLIALAGPAAPAGAAVVLATVALAASEPTLALLACPLGGHALAATVACGDGRSACGL